MYCKHVNMSSDGFVVILNGEVMMRKPVIDWEDQTALAEINPYNDW